MISRALIGCERSGIVREALRRRGIDAWSCDIEPADDGSPFHIQDDIVNVLNRVDAGYYDLGIFHPECTALSVSGNRTYSKGKPDHYKRINAAKWTYDLWELAILKIGKVAFENPVGVLNTLTKLPKAQYTQPCEHGHAETKKTGLWLHNLPKLIPTNIVEPDFMRKSDGSYYVGAKGQKYSRIHFTSGRKDPAERKRIRSETYTGVAAAFATQWGI